MKYPFSFDVATFNGGGTREEAYGDLNYCKIFLETLKEETTTAKSEEENLRIWSELRKIASDLEKHSVMKLPYARVNYPILVALCDEIRAELKKNLESSPNKPKNWKLFRCE